MTAEAMKEVCAGATYQINLSAAKCKISCSIEMTDDHASVTGKKTECQQPNLETSRLIFVQKQNSLEGETDRDRPEG